MLVSISHPLHSDASRFTLKIRKLPQLGSSTTIITSSISFDAERGALRGGRFLHPKSARAEANLISSRVLFISCHSFIVNCTSLVAFVLCCQERRRWILNDLTRKLSPVLPLSIEHRDRKEGEGREEQSRAFTARIWRTVNAVRLDPRYPWRRPISAAW